MDSGSRRLVEDRSPVDGLTASRVEAFSDAVFAIAITLLVLQLGPASGQGSLSHRLGEQWPLYVAYLLSFLNIGIVWLNHHSISAACAASTMVSSCSTCCCSCSCQSCPFRRACSATRCGAVTSPTNAPRHCSTPATFCSPPLPFAFFGFGRRAADG
jgi:Endosomal/lysosomal potassium channel TMEM175